MEIPKNTTQIGEVHGNYKVFIEDYVISYMKQLCRQEPDRKKRIALYGVLRTEEPQQYFFIYGGSEVPRHGKNDYYLAKQDYEEITWAGEKYFETYVSLGFVTVEDELPEGVYLFCAGKEVFVKGYHIFYEKNESMLTFLIHKQNEKNELKQEVMQEIQPQEKSIYEQEQPEEKEPLPTPRHSEARQMMKQKNKENVSPGEVKLFGIVKSAAAALFIVLCVTAISTMNGLGKMEDIQNYFQKAFQTMKEKKIPDKEETLPVTAPNIEQESIMNKMQKENLQTNPEPNEATEASVSENVVVEEEVPISENAQVSEPKTYLIQKGETLISISKIYYGDESKVQEICELNGITNSDNIQVGQKIVLP